MPARKVLNRPSANSRRLGFQSLENRQLLAASIGVDPAGVLSISGTPGNDKAEVRYAEKTVVVKGVRQQVEDTDFLVVRLQSDVGGVAVSQTVASKAVTSILFDGHGGGDYLINSTGKPANWSVESGGSVSTELPAATSAGVDPVTNRGGGFLVGTSGQVNVHSVGNRKDNPSEVAVFSLEGMDHLVPGTPEFVREAARRALTDSVAGRIAISDYFTSGPGSSEDRGQNPQAMTPGDRVGVLSVSNGSIWGVYTGAVEPTGDSVRLSVPGLLENDGITRTTPAASGGTTFALDLGPVSLNVSGVTANPVTPGIPSDPSDPVGPSAPGGPGDVGGDVSDPEVVIGTADLKVFVFSDTNHDGVIGLNEPPLKGIQVVVSGIDADGNEVTRTGATEDDGCVLFDELPEGTYRITSVDPTGRTLDGLGLIGSLGGERIVGGVAEIELSAGDLAEGYSLGRILPGQLRGRVYVDSNVDGIFTVGEQGIEGVTVVLAGTDDQGQAVGRSTHTAADGSYLFDGLRPGTYTLSQIQPAGYVDGRESIGSFLGRPHPIDRNGGIGNDTFSAIVLRAGEEGYNYNFGEWLQDPTRPAYQAQHNFLGTVGDDVIEIALGDTAHQVTINGTVHTIDASQSMLLSLDARDGDDAVRIVGIPGEQRMTISPGLATLIAPNVRIEVLRSRSVSFVGGVGDRAFLYDTPGDDVYRSSVDQRVLESNGHRAEVIGVERVYAYATAGGTDRAIFTGSSRADTFKATPADARLYDDQFYNFASGFGSYEAIAGPGGVDRAYLYDSAGDDLLEAAPDTVRLSGDGFELIARGFSRVDADSSEGGRDAAVMVGSAGDDRYHAGPVQTQMIGPGYDNRAVGFATSVGSGGAGGFDRAYLTGTNGDNVLNASYAQARLTGPELNVVADFFDWVMVTGNCCVGTSVAYLTDSPGNDTLELNPQSARIYGPGYTIRAENFSQIHGESSNGGTDRAIFKDSAGNDLLEASAGWARLSGPGFVNSASGFGNIRVDATAGGDDRAVLSDSDGNDTLTASGNNVTLSTAGYVVAANGFDSVLAIAGEGEDKKRISAVDYVLELIGGWEE